MVVRDETVNGCVLRVPDMRHPSLRFHPMLRSVQDNFFKSTFPEPPSLVTELIWPLVECASTLPLNFLRAVS